MNLLEVFKTKEKREKALLEALKQVSTALEFYHNECEPVLDSGQIIESDKNTSYHADFGMKAHDAMNKVFTEIEASEIFSTGEMEVMKKVLQ